MKPAINNLNNVLTFHLEGMYDAEKKLQKCIPNFLTEAQSRALKAELKNYYDSATDKRIKLKRIFSYLLAGPFGRKNYAMSKMLLAAEDFSHRTSTPELKDAVLIACFREITHYKISAYGTAISFSEELGLDHVTDLLSEVLKWEKNTDQALSKILLMVNKTEAAMSLI